MDPFAIPKDYTDRGYDDSRFATGVLATRLEAASRLVRARVADVDERVTSGDLDPELVADVVCAVVARSVPGDGLAGVTSAQQTAGPFSRSLTYANPAGDLYLTKAELRDLGGRLQRASSVSMMPEGAGSEYAPGWVL